MKVALMNDSFPPVIDGVANVVTNYAGILQKEGLADVLVATPRYPDADYTGYPYKVVPYMSFDTTKIVKGYRAGNPFVISELKEMADFNPNIIHSHCPVSSTVLARMLRTRTEAPIIFTYHTKFDVDIAKAVKTEFVRKETIRALVSNIEACDEVWTVSRGAGENLRSLGFEGEYRVVSNGVDFPKGKVDNEDVMRVTGGYDLPAGVPVFLFVGRIIKYKGLPLILDALAKLNADGTDFRMVFVGSGPDEDELKEKAESLGLLNKSGAGSKVIFTGPVHEREDLRAWNSRANLFLFPSTYDTNGIVVREAAACGLASVLIEGSCAAEGITDGRNGFLIKENADSMYALLKELVANPEKMEDAGQHAEDEIYISWETSVREAYRRYAEVIDNKAAGLYKTKRHRVAGKLKEYTDDFIYEIRERTGDITDGLKEYRDDIAGELKEYKDEIFYEIDKLAHFFHINDDE